MSGGMSDSTWAGVSGEDISDLEAMYADCLTVCDGNESMARDLVMMELQHRQEWARGKAEFDRRVRGYNARPRRRWWHRFRACR